MAKFDSILKVGGGILGRTAMNVIGAVAGKLIADKMTKKALKEQTGFESTEEILADAQAKAAKAQADALAQVEASKSQEKVPGLQTRPVKDI